MFTTENTLIQYYLQFPENYMKIRLLPFILTGLIAGFFSLLILYLLPEIYILNLDIFFLLAFPGVIIALALLFLSKTLRVKQLEGSRITEFPYLILLIASIVIQILHIAIPVLLTNFLPFNLHRLFFSLDMWVLWKYPIEMVQNTIVFTRGSFLQGLSLYLLPSPLGGGLQAFFITTMISIIWNKSLKGDDTKISPLRSGIIAGIYGALFTIVIAFLSAPIFYVTMNFLFGLIGQFNQIESLWLLNHLSLIINPFLWYPLLFLAIYGGLRKSPLYKNPGEASISNEEDFSESRPQRRTDNRIAPKGFNSGTFSEIELLKRIMEAKEQRKKTVFCLKYLK